MSAINAMEKYHQKVREWDFLPFRCYSWPYKLNTDLADGTFLCHLGMSSSLNNTYNIWLGSYGWYRQAWITTIIKIEVVNEPVSLSYYSDDAIVK